MISTFCLVGQALGLRRPLRPPKAGLKAPRSLGGGPTHCLRDSIGAQL